MHNDGLKGNGTGNGTGNGGGGGGGERAGFKLSDEVEFQLGDEEMMKTVEEEEHLEFQDNQDPGDLVDDFLHSPMDEVTKMSLSFKIHLVVALTLCLASFFGFHFTTLLQHQNPSSVFPWWMFPWFLFAMTLSGHHFFSQGNKWTGTVVMVIIFHIAIFIVNKILTPQYDWFWYSLLLCLMYGMYQYYTAMNASALRKFSYVYMILSALIFITWLNLHDYTEFPWFIYPIGMLGLPLMLWYMFQVYKERRWHLYGAVVAVDLNLQILVTWGFMETVWPWYFLYSISFQFDRDSD
eukprot:TRINITY_DN7853_c0_g1_i2.p1 TRINITY_DN7853_c0_g1~~TRINITY_DN7853_c0_g1_i2.p1  ORF type:complete len:294 (-),score=55.83 TRINITY_DN7853_c0_g1_i2:60-941(-)